MQFLISVIDHQTGMATPAEMAAITEFNGRLKAAGHWILAGGLTQPSAATVIDNRGQEPLITNGPLQSTEEYISGFWIIEAPDRNRAGGLAAEASKHCNRKVELRPLLGE